jgi:hypothetical protein
MLAVDKHQAHGVVGNADHVHIRQGHYAEAPEEDEQRAVDKQEATAQDGRRDLRVSHTQKPVYLAHTP